MSRILSSTSNSNLPDASVRTFPTSYSAQSGFSGAALNESGNMQGSHNIHGGYSMPNMPGPYASRNSANLSGLQNGVQQAQGSVANGIYAMNSLPNALSQLSLGNSHGHSSIPNTGGQYLLPYMGNTGRMANTIGGPVGGDNSLRGSSSANVANIPGLASRVNLNGHIDFSAPQMVSMLGNSYSGADVPLAQNQYQAGSNQFSYTALLNDPNTPDSASLDLNDFPQLSGHPHSAGGSQGHLGLMQQHTINYTHQNQEFSMQNEDFPALPGYKGGVNIGNGAEYSLNTPQNDQLHDMSQLHDMTKIMQSQPLSIGRSSGYNFGASYPSHHQQQQQCASSINGGGVSYLSSNQDLHFHGPEQYQQLQMSQSRFTNPYRENEMISSVFQYPIVPDKYGMLGLLNAVKMDNPSWTSLALGIDLTTLGMNLNSPELLYKKFASPWSDEPVRGEPEYTVPDCYYAKQPPHLTQSHFAKFRVETLLYIFYSMPKDEAQLFASNELYNRGWFYHRELRTWFMRMQNMEPLAKTNTHERGSYFIFDPNSWQTIRKDNFVLQYDMIEKRPILLQH